MAKFKVVTEMEVPEHVVAEIAKEFSVWRDSQREHDARSHIELARDFAAEREIES